MTTSEADTKQHGLIAICVVLASMAVGGAYYAYLVSEPFPPDIVRLAPFVWLVGAWAGLILSVQAIVANARRFLGIIGVLLSIPNIPLAAIYVLGALMGD